MNYPTVLIRDANGLYKPVREVTEDLEQKLREHFSFNRINIELDAPIFPSTIFSCFVLPTSHGHFIKGVSCINDRFTPIFWVSTDEGWDRAWEMAKAIASMLKPEASGASKLSGWQLIRQYRFTRPDVAIAVSLEEDLDHEWDGDGEPPEGQQPYIVVVTASTIRNGQLITGSDGVCGCYYPNASCHPGEAYGQLREIVETAVRDLDSQLQKANR